MPLTTNLECWPLTKHLVNPLSAVWHFAGTVRIKRYQKFLSPIIIWNLAGMLFKGALLTIVREQVVSSIQS